jgi:hypothetical protein
MIYYPMENQHEPECWECYERHVYGCDEKMEMEEMRDKEMEEIIPLPSDELPF